MLEFILKDDYSWDDENYDYLVKIYDVEHEENVMSAITDYIQFIKDNREIMDDCEINYICKFLDEMFPKHEIIPLKDFKMIYY